MERERLSARVRGSAPVKPTDAEKNIEFQVNEKRQLNPEVYGINPKVYGANPS